MDFPIIDMARYRDGDPARRSAIAAQVDDACRNTGFIVLTGHGISKTVLSQAHAVAEAFFDLPLETKLKYEKAEGSFYGYYQMESSALAYTLDEESSPDLREAFASNRPDIETGDPYFRSDAVQNLGYVIPYPKEIADFHEIWTQTYYTFAGLGHEIMQMFAAALHQPEHQFDDMLTRHASNLAVFKYPAQKTPPKDRQFRCGAHTDYGSLTLVHSDWSISGGLQIQTHDGTWLDVPNVPDSLVINIGDMMQRWTNDRWRSTLHRVGNPEAGLNGSSERMSLVFFYNPNQDGVVETIASCIDEDNPARYDPITVSDHFLMKMGKMVEEQ